MKLYKMLIACTETALKVTLQLLEAILSLQVEDILLCDLKRSLQIFIIFPDEVYQFLILLSKIQLEEIGQKIQVEL